MSKIVFKKIQIYQETHSLLQKAYGSKQLAISHNYINHESSQIHVIVYSNQLEVLQHVKHQGCTRPPSHGSLSHCTHQNVEQQIEFLDF